MKNGQIAIASAMLFALPTLAAPLEDGAYYTPDWTHSHAQTLATEASAIIRVHTHELKPHAFGRKWIFPTYKLKSQDMADILNDGLGVPCSKFDVDNAKKKTAFIPHQVPNCAQAVAILRKPQAHKQQHAVAI